MLAVAAAGTGQPTKRQSLPVAQAAAAVPKRREPTPDHPPYSWMIGEAIEALGEGGGSTEAAISGFIRDRHPGVPAGAAHDRFLRHYLAKHVAEGLFVRTEPGRYSRHPDEPVVAQEEAPAVKPAAAAASAGSPLATEAKRGRGRPRKDRSTPASAAGKKGGSEPPSATPKRRGRGRPRVLPLVTTTDVSGEALVTDKKDGSEAPSTADKNHEEPRELALVIVNDDGYATPSFTENDAGEAPSAKLAVLAKEDGAAAFTTPENSTQPCELAPVVADECSAPACIADKTDVTEAPTAKYKRRLRPCTSAPVNAAHGSAPTSIADEVSGKAVSTTPKGRGRQRKLALVATATATAGPARTLVAGKRDGNEAPSVPVKPRGQPSKLFLLTADEVPDNQMFCVLALPAQIPAATKA